MLLEEAELLRRAALYGVAPRHRIPYPCDIDGDLRARHPRPCNSWVRPRGVVRHHSDLDVPRGSRALSPAGLEQRRDQHQMPPALLCVRDRLRQVQPGPGERDGPQQGMAQEGASAPWLRRGRVWGRGAARGMPDMRRPRPTAARSRAPRQGTVVPRTRGVFHVAVDSVRTPAVPARPRTCRLNDGAPGTLIGRKSHSRRPHHALDCDRSKTWGPSGGRAR